MDHSKSRPPLTVQEFLSIIRGDPRPEATARFVAAIRGDGPARPDEPLAEYDRPAQHVSHEDWLNAVLYGIHGPTHPDYAGPVREYNFNPDEPRDGRGRWTTGGTGTASAGTGGAQTVPSPSAASGGMFNVADFRRDFSHYEAILDKTLGGMKNIPPQERQMRREIVIAALNGKIRFDPYAGPNPAHWQKNADGEYALRPGHVADGLEDRVYNNGAPTGCRMATKTLFLQGMSTLAHRQDQDAQFDQHYAGQALKDLFPDRQSSELQKFTDHKADLSPPQFVPGDRLWMKNHRFVPADGAGHEGSNVVYLGKDEHGVPLFIHTTLDPNDTESSVVTYKQLQRDVRGYSTANLDQPENYHFQQRYKPQVPAWLKKGIGR